MGDACKPDWPYKPWGQVTAGFAHKHTKQSSHLGIISKTSSQRPAKGQPCKQPLPGATHEGHSAAQAALLPQGPGHITNHGLQVLRHDMALPPVCPVRAPRTGELTTTGVGDTGVTRSGAPSARRNQGMPNKATQGQGPAPTSGQADKGAQRLRSRHPGQVRHHHMLL